MTISWLTIIACLFGSAFMNPEKDEVPEEQTCAKQEDHETLEDPNVELAIQLHEEKEEQHKRELTKKPRHPKDSSYAHSDENIILEGEKIPHVEIPIK